MKRKKFFALLITLSFGFLIILIQSAFADTPISNGFDYPLGYTTENGYADGTGYDITGLGFLELWDYENSDECNINDPSEFCTITLTVPAELKV